MPPPDRSAERGFLSSVTGVQRWKQIATISEPGNFAPGVVARREGGFRIYWNAAGLGGIASAISSDGLTWKPERGLRLANGGAGTADAIASHPWVIALDSGYLMYYQGDAAARTDGDRSGKEPEFRIFRAFSRDGLTFRREGVVIDIGSSTGFRQAAHGRIIRLDDGSYRMFFSANFIGKNGPADILGASSPDGRNWTMDTAPILERGHDPTVLNVDDRIVLFTTFLRDNFIVMDSADGRNFTPVAWLDFYDPVGQRIEHFGDAEAMKLPDGRVVLIGSGKGSRGLGVFTRED